MGRRLRYLPYERTLVEITNRTIQERLLLRPTKALREIVLGALGRSQQRYGVEIHAFVFLSNHYHLLISVRDVQQMARFVGYFESKLAKEVGRLTGWRDKVWARRYSAIPVSNEEAAQVGRLEYLLSNGVKEGFVSHPRDWPGAHSVDALLVDTPLEGVWYDRTAEFNARVRKRRVLPTDFASPETVEISPLPCWRDEPAVVRRRAVEQLVEGIVTRGKADKSRYRKLLLGAKPTDRPVRAKRSPAPWFHCASKAVRRDLKQAYSEFLVAYQRAAAALRRGELTAPFPDGCFPPPRPFVVAA